MEFKKDEEESRKRKEKKMRSHNNLVKKRLEAVEYDFEKGGGMTQLQQRKLAFLDSIDYNFENLPGVAWLLTSDVK
jgi:DNA replication protein DnaC